MKLKDYNLSIDMDTRFLDPVYDISAFSVDINQRLEALKTKLELREYCTSWEVNVTDDVILSGTEDKTTGLTYKVDVPACMIESFDLNLRNQNPDAGKITTNDYIDWGDGIVTMLSDVTYEKTSLSNSIIRFTQCVVGEELRCYIIAAHEYAIPGKYKISVVGKNIDCINHAIDNDGMDFENHRFSLGLAKNVYDDFNVVLSGDQISGTLSAVSDKIDFGDDEVVALSSYNPLSPSGYLQKATYTAVTDKPNKGTYVITLGRTYATDGKKTVSLVTDKDNHQLDSGTTKAANSVRGWQITVNNVKYSSLLHSTATCPNIPSDSVSLNNTSNIFSLSKALRIYNHCGKDSLKLLRVCPATELTIDPTDKVRLNDNHMWFHSSFQQCENLQSIRNMSKLFGGVDTFQCAWLFNKYLTTLKNNLLESDMRLPYKNNSTTGELHVNGYYMYCDNLDADILDLLPEDGFYTGITVNMTQTFSNCKNLYCSNYEKLAKLLWNNQKNVKFKGTKSTFDKCEKLDKSQIPTSWGGIMV